MDRLKISAGRQWCAAALLLASVSVSSADTVVLSDGSRLNGVISRLSAESITLQTAFAADPLVIDAAMVQQVETDEEITVDTASGDRLVGKVVWEPVTQSAVVKTKFGDLRVPRDELSGLWPVGAMSPEEIAIQEELERQKPKWSFTAEIGGTKKEGNTDTVDFYGGIELSRKTMVDLLRFYVTGRYGETDQIRDTSEVILGSYYEHLLFNSDRWYGYGRFELEYDEFENLELRATLAGGMGYYWIKEEHHELKTRLGAGYLHESYMDGTTDNSATLDVGLDYRVEIKPWMQFVHSATYIPTFDGIDDYRLDFDTAILVPFKDERFAFKIGMRNEYNSMPLPGIERLDNTYYANLLVNID
jgi:putative salt-induced outer membrane protein YdiY